MREITKRPADLRERTKVFTLDVVRLYAALPKITEAQILGRQMLRSGTSVGAHYHEAHRSRSDAEFISKMEGGLQELEETTYWVELLLAARIIGADQARPLLTEADELSAIMVTVARNVKRRARR